MSPAPRELSESERLDWLRLIRSENVGPITFCQILRRYGSAGAGLAALPELARRGGRRASLRVFPRGEAERESEALAALGGRFVALGEADYPPALAAVTDAPPLIAVHGHAHLLRRHAVAIVGARNASASGNRFARQIAADLGAEGLVVVSGLARGIDASAHVGALSHGTIAVVAGGVDVVYPAENETLHHRIAEEGALISEQPLAMVPQGRHFPRRNRIIAGVALGTLVVEAAPRSGSLITARLALEQGREVFAVPGSPLDPRCRGANNLIRQGAVLTEGAADVIEALEGVLRQPLDERKTPEFEPLPAAPSDEAALGAARRAVVEKLGPTPVTVDEIIRQCQVTAAVALTILLELELAGRLDRHPGNQVSLRV
ncbi:MAG: DNA-processing protein DprA [Alphaproteobacteria bacterium]